MDKFQSETKEIERTQTIPFNGATLFPSLQEIFEQGLIPQYLLDRRDEQRKLIQEQESLQESVESFQCFQKVLEEYQKGLCEDEIRLIGYAVLSQSRLKYLAEDLKCISSDEAQNSVVLLSSVIQYVDPLQVPNKDKSAAEQKEETKKVIVRSANDVVDQIIKKINERLEAISPICSEEIPSPSAALQNIENSALRDLEAAIFALATFTQEFLDSVLSSCMAVREKTPESQSLEGEALEDIEDLKRAAILLRDELPESITKILPTFKFEGTSTLTIDVASSEETEPSYIIVNESATRKDTARKLKKSDYELIESLLGNGEKRQHVAIALLELGNGEDGKGPNAEEVSKHISDRFGWYNPDSVSAHISILRGLLQLPPADRTKGIGSADVVHALNRRLDETLESSEKAIERTTECSPEWPLQGRPVTSAEDEMLQSFFGTRQLSYYLSLAMLEHGQYKDGSFPTYRTLGKQINKRWMKNYANNALRAEMSKMRKSFKISLLGSETSKAKFAPVMEEVFKLVGRIK